MVSCNGNGFRRHRCSFNIALSEEVYNSFDSNGVRKDFAACLSSYFINMPLCHHSELDHCQNVPYDYCTWQKMFFVCQSLHILFSSLYDWRLNCIDI